MPGWIPNKIVRMEEFLPDELKPLRDHVWKTRSDEISIGLHVFEERVMFASEIWNELNRLLPWETIRVYEHDTRPNDQLKKYKTDKRKIKQCFLRGWIEIRLWDNGCHQKQKIYQPETKALGFETEEKDHFFHGETIHFSLVAEKNFRERFLEVNPRIRPEIGRYIERRLAISDAPDWHVYVAPELWVCYYGIEGRVEIRHEKRFALMEDKMITINCPKDTESNHAAIANFDSWQAYLHDIATKDKPMPFDRSILDNARKLRKEAEDDDTPVPDEVKSILKRIATDTRLCELSESDREKIRRASDMSPKIRMMVRMAQHRYVRQKTAEHHAREVAVPPVISDSVPMVAKELVLWISELWTPLWAGEPVTAEDVKEQEHIYQMEDGEIKTFCYWEDEHHGDPAYIRLKWRADIAFDSVLWARFVDPINNRILYESRLGEHRDGEEIFTAKELGFNPLRRKWAVCVLLVEPGS